MSVTNFGGGAGYIRLTIQGTKSVDGKVQPATLYDSGNYHIDKDHTISWYASFSSNVKQTTVIIETWVNNERKSSFRAEVTA